MSERNREPSTPSEAGLSWRLVLRLLGRLPQPALSRLAGRLADIPIPRPLRLPLLGTFVRVAGINADEAAEPLSEYRTFDAFFVRRLRSGIRSWPTESQGIGSPVDGCFGESGSIDNGRLLQAKGRSYTVEELLDDADAGERFRHGTFVTLYLSPRHYHRIHAPTSGGIRELRRVPGALLPVNRPAVASVDRLFPRNERAICTIEGPACRVAVVAVGAYNVGRITASFVENGSFGPTQVTNLPNRKARLWTFDPPVDVDRGDEIMAFHLGSTVILLFEANRVDLDVSIANGKEVRLGTQIAVFHSET